VLRPAQVNWAGSLISGELPVKTKLDLTNRERTSANSSGRGRAVADYFGDFRAATACSHDVRAAAGFHNEFRR